MLKKSLPIVFFVLLVSFVLSETCERSWRCEGAYRIYRNSGCEILVREYCTYGCKVDGCVEIKTCTPGFVCNGNFRQRMEETCTVSSNTYCQYGCFNGTCIVKPEKTLEIEEKKNITELVPQLPVLNNTISIEDNISQNKTEETMPVKKITLLERLGSFIKKIIEKISNVFS
jgi:hypothetical protein